MYYNTVAHSSVATVLKTKKKAVMLNTSHVTLFFTWKWKNFLFIHFPCSVQSLASGYGAAYGWGSAAIMSKQTALRKLDETLRQRYLILYTNNFLSSYLWILGNVSSGSALQVLPWTQSLKNQYLTVKQLLFICLFKFTCALFWSKPTKYRISRIGRKECPQ